jgi:hypothetical protein
MRSKPGRIAAAIAVVGVLAIGGTALTASNTIPASVAGYGTSTISGATATALTYTLAADGTTITGADLTFTGDQTGRTVKAGFGTAALTACTVGTFESVGNTTPVTCSGYTQSTASSSTFNVAVS